MEEIRRLQVAAVHQRGNRRAGALNDARLCVDGEQRQQATGDEGGAGEDQQGDE